MLALPIALLLAAPVQIVLMPGSRLWIEGDSNLRTWSCQAAALETAVEAQTFENGKPPSVREVRLAVPVQELRCGDEHMEGKLREALRADQHPRIEYVLSAVEKLGPATSGEHRLKATGSLTIAGRQRSLTMVVRAGAQADGTLHAQGSVPLQMTDFGVEPPSAILGLVKCKDRIVIRFELRGRTAQLVN